MELELTANPFHFGVQAYNASSANAWVELVQSVEDLGYWSFHVPDHYLGPGPVVEATGHPPQELAALISMAVACQATKRLRVGSRMLCVDYHQPAVLAKEAATLDFLSGGRLELGLGAGWLREEYEAMGIAFLPASDRIEKLGEVITLIEEQWSGRPISVDGQFVKVRDYVGLPQFEGSSRPRIMIGGGGKRILKLAANRADIVSMNWSNSSGRFDSNTFASTGNTSTKERVEWIRECAGERWDQIEIEVGVPFLFVTSDSRRTRVELAGRLGLSVDQVSESPHILIGSTSEISETLYERREIFGISYITILEKSLIESGSGFKEFAEVVGLLSGQDQ